MTSSVSSLSSVAEAWAARAIERATGFELVLPAHEYRRRADGVAQLGVTTVLKHQGFLDVEHFTEEGRARGTYVHAASVLIDEDDLDFDDVPEAWRGYCESYVGFIETYRPRFFLTEQLVVDDVLGYCGTLDRFGLIDERLWTIDLKTGSKDRWHGVQVAAYERCLRPPDSTRSAKRGVVYLYDDGKPGKLEPFVDRIDYDYWLAALTCSRYREKFV